MELFKKCFSKYLPQVQMVQFVLEVPVNKSHGEICG